LGVGGGRLWVGGLEVGREGGSCVVEGRGGRE